MQLLLANNADRLTQPLLCGRSRLAKSWTCELRNSALTCSYETWVMTKKKKKIKNPKGNGVCILRRTLKWNSCCFNEEQPVVGCSGIVLPLLHAEVCSLRWTRPAGNLRAHPEDDGSTKYAIWPADSIGGRWRSSPEKLHAPYLFCCSRSSPRAGQPAK